MRATEFICEAVMYTQQDVDQIVRRLPSGLITTQIQAVARDYLERVYGTGTAGFIIYQGIMNDILNRYNQMHGTNLSTRVVYNAPTKSKTKKQRPAQKKTVATDQEEIQNKINDLKRRIQKAEWRVEIGTDYLRKYQQDQYRSAEDKLRYAEIEDNVLYWTKQLIELKKQLADLTS